MSLDNTIEGSKKRSSPQGPNGGTPWLEPHEEWAWANRNLSHKGLAAGLGRGTTASRVRRYEIRESLVAALRIACQNDYTQESIQEAATWLKKRSFLENDLREIAAVKPCLEDIRDHVKRYCPLPDNAGDGLDEAKEGGLSEADGLESPHAKVPTHASAPGHAYRERAAAGGDESRPFTLSAAEDTLHFGRPPHHDIGIRTLGRFVPLNNETAAGGKHIQQADLNHSFEVSPEQEQRDTGRNWTEQTAEILFAASQLFPSTTLRKSYEEFYSYLVTLQRDGAEEASSTGLPSDEQSPATNRMLNASQHYKTLEHVRHDILESMNASIAISQKRSASGADEKQMKRIQQNAMAHHFSQNETEESLEHNNSRKRRREAMPSLTDYNLHESRISTNMTDSADMFHEPSKRHARTTVPAASSSQTPLLPNLHHATRGHNESWRRWSHRNSGIDDNKAILESIRGNIVRYQDAVFGKKCKGMIIRHPPTREGEKEE